MSPSQRQAISEAIKNPALKNVFNKLYQATDKLPGGTAGAIKFESVTGKLLSPAGHAQKGLETISRLNKILQNSNLVEIEKKIAQTLLNQLKNVIK